MKHKMRNGDTAVSAAIRVEEVCRRAPKRARILRKLTTDSVMRGRARDAERPCRKSRMRTPAAARPAQSRSGSD